MRRLTDALLAALVPLLILLHLFLAPYTKVEESFNIQATHDVLTYGVPVTDIYAKLHALYDHTSFPGPVPRTFIGPLALAGLSWPFAWSVEGLDRQILVRALLGLFNAFCILSFRNGVAKGFGRYAANWYTVLQASQFHMMYYASRTLPNLFAFGLTTLASRYLLPSFTSTGYQSHVTTHNHKRALILLTIAGVIFRSEIAILLGAQTVYLLLQRRLTLQDTVSAGILGLSIGLSLTVPIDSFFWSRPPLWPELTGFMYNVLQGESVNWGTSPFHYYFTSAIPRLLLNPFTYQICIPFTLATRPLRSPALDILIPNLAFITIYSFQPHKEWRFIIYTIPPLTAVAAIGASWIWIRRAKSLAYRILALVLIASTLASFAASFGMLAVSRLNYPGAQALNRLHAVAHGSQDVIKVHMDTLSCMTGVTRFLQIPPSVAGSVWVYDKTDDETQLLDPSFWDKFDYALAERPEKAIGAWEIVDVIDGFAGLTLLKPGDREAAEVLGTAQQDISPSEKTLRRRGQGFWKWWKRFEDVMRKSVTKGWWVQARMEPKIRILRKVKMGVEVPLPLSS